MLEQEFRSVVLRLADSGVKEEGIIHALFSLRFARSVGDTFMEYDAKGLEDAVLMQHKARSDVHNFLILNRGITGSILNETDSGGEQGF
jgi:hypothetical protein